MALNGQTCAQTSQPMHAAGSIFERKRPGAVSSPRTIAGQPSLKHAPQDLHLAGSTACGTAPTAFFAAMTQEP